MSTATQNWCALQLNRWQKLLTAEQARKLPALYSQDGKGSAATAVVKFFAGGLTWFASEFDPETGTFFGYVVNHREIGKSEFGYFMASELSAAQTPRMNRGPNNSFRIVPVVERDLSFQPQTIAAAVLAAGGPDLAAVDEADADAEAAEVDSELEESEQAARDSFDALYGDTAAIARELARNLQARADAVADSTPPAGLDPSQF